MRRLLITILVGGGALGCGGGATPAGDDLSAATGDMALVASSDLTVTTTAEDLAGADFATGGDPTAMTFFISSRTGSGNLGSLLNADMLCQNLAAAVGAGQRKWVAYLSNSIPAPTNARDRIGTGPWRNRAGVQIAASVADLHSPANNITKATGLDENGATVPGRGDTPNQHDILTGSKSDGTLDSANTCSNWASEAGTATVGHFDRQGGGTDPTSWNSAHVSQGCSAAQLVSTGGAGRIYCFATN